MVTTRNLFFVFFFTVVTLGAARAELNPLDNNFFSNPTNGESNNRVQVLSPDFFESRQGRLDNSAPGQYGCQAVWSQTANGEAGAIGRVAQNYCAGEPSVRWIPNTRAKELNRTVGYYQVCCVVKGSSGRRRQRVR